MRAALGHLIPSERTPVLGGERSLRISATGQSRHFYRRPMTSGLPRWTDILRVRRHVLKVPIGDMTLRAPLTAESRAKQFTGTEVIRHLTPTSAISSVTFGLMACAAAMSASLPARSPFSRLATPRPYNEIAVFGSTRSAAS